MYSCETGMMFSNQKLFTFRVSHYTIIVYNTQKNFSHINLFFTLAFCTMNQLSIAIHVLSIHFVTFLDNM